MTEILRPEQARAGAGWGWLLAYGVLSALLGVLAFLSPLSATLAATWVIGAFLIATGLTSAVAGAQARNHQHRGYAILFGVLTLIVGVLMIIRPLSAALSLTLLIAGWLLARGLLELGYAFAHARHRGMMILLGVVNILLSLWVVSTVPLSALTLPGYLLGFSLLLGGITAMTSAIAHRHAVPALTGR